MNRCTVLECALGLAVAVSFLAPVVVASQVARHGEGTRSSYAGQETRSIKSMSEEDLAELRRGGGWGLAKAAELNGIPGPAHLLELKDQIPLAEEQVERIDAIFRDMRARAIAEGERLIAQEQALEDALRARTIDGVTLRTMLAAIASNRSELRYVHLVAHLEALPLLTEAQIARYQELRGYGADPCATVPARHDPAMGRRHHGCN